MLSQTLQITHFETVHFGSFERCGNGNQLTVGKDIASNKAGFLSARCRSRRCNAMIEEDTTWAQELPCLFEIGGQQCFTNLLEHANADQLIIRPLDLTIIP